MKRLGGHGIRQRLGKKWGDKLIKRFRVGVMRETVAFERTCCDRQPHGCLYAGGFGYRIRKSWGCYLGQNGKGRIRSSLEFAFVLCPRLAEGEKPSLWCIG